MLALRCAALLVLGAAAQGGAFAQGDAKRGAYLAKAATETGAVKTASGLVYKEVTAGTGISPKAADTVPL